MNQNLDIQDLSIVLAIGNNNPTIITPDFLKGSGVIPGDWELETRPVLLPQVTRIAYQNGVKIEAQAGGISFYQGLDLQKLSATEIPNIARLYVEKLPNLQYQGIGINPRRFVNFATADQAHRYLSETILSRGSWQDFGIAPLQMGVNLVYTLEGCKLRLAINEARLQIADKEPTPAVLFAGNFDYLLTGNSREERLTNLQGILGNWQSDFSAYQSLINNKSRTSSVRIPSRRDGRRSRRQAPSR